ncbi:MAG: site-specific integrase, partial [Acidobacteriales bacterium]|nr:site-specific integrase [Terriglobales bacterium]
WELKFDVGADPATGRRKIRYVSFKGTKKQAEQKLVALLAAEQKGESVDPSRVTVAEYLRSWLNADIVIGNKGKALSAKTLERYRQLAEQQIIPHLGATALQKLRPAQIQEWHTALLTHGGKDGAPLSARTVGHAHRVLHEALARAAAAETVHRNVAAIVKAPHVETEEVEILEAEQITGVLKALRDHGLHRIVSLALATGARRGELLGLQWGDVDLDASTLTIQRSVEETKSGLRLKAPKTKHGRRTISLPRTAVELLRSHLREQRELRVALGAGREAKETLVFSTVEGGLLSPDNVSRDWARTVKSRKLPQVSFHALRHTHASALIAAGLDVVKISRRLGHSSPNVTLTVYAHVFEKTDTTAATAIEAALQLGG